MSGQDLLDISESLRNFQIQQEQNICEQRELTKELNHILKSLGGGQTNPHWVGRVSPVTSGRVSPTVSERTTRVPTIHITRTGSGTHRHTFTIGDQVYITNCITRLVLPGPLD